MIPYSYKNSLQMHYSSGALTLWWSLRKYKKHYCLMPHKILTSPFHRRGGHTQFDWLIVCGIINQCLLNDKFPHAHSQCRVNASESTGGNWIYFYLFSYIKWFSRNWQKSVTFSHKEMIAVTTLQDRLSLPSAEQDSVQVSLWYIEHLIGRIYNVLLEYQSNHYSLLKMCD